MAARGQPIIILSEESTRTRGRDAQSMNIAAGRAVAEAVRTTLGPEGMDKMLVDDIGSVVVSNDGVTILDEMEVDHPAAQMIVEVADAQEDETGDGTTTAVILAGELLGKAQDLLDEDIHPSTIASGYLEAADHARAFLQEIAVDVDPDDTEVLTNIAKTAMTGKGSGAALDHLAELAVQTVQQVADEDRIDLDNVKLETVTGGSVHDSALIQGVLVDKDPALDDMPVSIQDAKIALFGTDIDIQESETDAEVNLSDPDQLRQFLDREETELRGYVDTILETGANVVFCQKGIEDRAQHWFAKEGVLAVRRVKKSDMKMLARATGGRIVSKVDDITEDDLGAAGLVEHREIGDDEQIFIEDCDNPKSVTIVIRGSTDHVVDEVERSIHDALEVIRVTIEDGKVVPGGGAPETEVALELMDYAEGVGGREQLAIEAFAEAMEIVPRTLAINGGADPIDVIVELRSRHSTGDVNAGFTVHDGVTDVWEQGIIEPLRVKSQAIASAQEAAELIIRIDDVISAGDLADDDDFDY